MADAILWTKSFSVQTKSLWSRWTKSPTGPWLSCCHCLGSTQVSGCKLSPTVERHRHKETQGETGRHRETQKDTDTGRHRDIQPAKHWNLDTDTGQPTETWPHVPRLYNMPQKTSFTFLSCFLRMNEGYSTNVFPLPQKNLHLYLRKQLMMMTMTVGRKEEEPW